MSPPATRVNTFMSVNKKPDIDFVSKTFIVVELFFGINRLLVLGLTKTIYDVIMMGYSLGLQILLLYFVVEIRHTHEFYFLIVGNLLRSLFCTSLSFILRARLMQFYLLLNKFDEDSGSNIYIERRKCLQNYLQLLLLIAFVISYNILCNYTKQTIMMSVFVTVTKLLHCFELHYYGHLFILIIPRIKFLTNYINLIHPDKKKVAQENADQDKDRRDPRRRFLQKSKNVKMKNFIELYNGIIVAFDILYASIKWQILLIIITTFCSSLDLAFHIAKGFIAAKFSQNLFLITVIFFLLELLPLLMPCVYAEQVAGEVRILKDLLSSKLYENVLDKSDRSSARSLLALIEARDLSFSLFHMFDIDIALPFKYLSLLLTYLIILLQFDKVINP